MKNAHYEFSLILIFQNIPGGAEVLQFTSAEEVPSPADQSDGALRRHPHLQGGPVRHGLLISAPPPWLLMIEPRYCSLSSIISTTRWNITLCVLLDPSEWDFSFFDHTVIHS